MDRVRTALRTTAHDIAFRRLLLLLVTLHALDLALTLAIFRLPGTFERNPIAATFFGHGPVYGALFKALGVAAGTLVLIGAYHAAPHGWRRWRRWLVGTLVAVAAVNDVYSMLVFVVALSRR